MNNENSTIELMTVVRQAQDVVSADVGDEVMLLGIEQSAYYDLKQTGGRIWSLLAEATSVRGVCSTLQQEFDVSASTCESQTLAYVQRLHAEGLVDVVSADEVLAGE